MLLYPCLDDRLETPSARRFVDTPAWRSDDSAHMWRHYLAGCVDLPLAYAVPSRSDDLTGLAPAYVLAAEFDPLRDEAVDYAARLLRAGVSAELHVVRGTFHGFDLAVPEADLSRHAYAEQLAALVRSFNA
jgi:acetyl esterase/lipase